MKDFIVSMKKKKKKKMRANVVSNVDVRRFSFGGDGDKDDARRIYKAPKGQREGMEMVKKKRVDYMLTMEQQRSGTHFPRKGPHSL
jgi:hypothetical protein